jgi:hypothetical protein
VLVLVLSPECVNGFVSVSRLSSALAYSSEIDTAAQTLMTSGIDYKGDYKHLTQSGQADTDCYIAVGDVNGFDRKVFDSPAMCLDVQVLGIPTEPSPDGLPEAVVAAMAGQQPILLSLDYKGEYSDLNLRDPVKLPFNHFPAKLTTDRNLGGVYVALHNTNGLGLAPASDEDPIDEFRNALDYLKSMTRPELLPGTGDYSPIIFKYDIVEQKAKWQTTLTTVNGRSAVGAIKVVLSRGKLIVVGSSNGSGTGVGANTQSGGDWDGYLTIIDLETGNMADKRNITTIINAPHSVSVFSQPGKDDFVYNVCTSDDKAFLVGSSQGKISGDEDGGGFVAKYDIDTLDILWEYQFVGKGIEATYCDVFDDLLYVGGTVVAGTVLDDPNSISNGKPSDTSDLFVARLSATTGELKWVRQIDSHRDDSMVGMVINLGNLVLITANGMSTNKGTSDLYVISVTPFGAHDWQNLQAGVDPISGATNAISIDVDNNGNNNEVEVADWVIPVAIGVPIAILLLFICYYYKTREPSNTSLAPRESPNVV